MNSRQQAAHSRQLSRRRVIFAGAVCCLLPAACCLAADPPPFVLYSVRNDMPAGPLTRLGADGAVQIGSAPVVAGADVVAVRRQGMPPPHFPHDLPHARLTNGDRIVGRLLGIAGDKLAFMADVGEPREISLPLSSLAAVWLTESAAAGAATPGGKRLLAEKRRLDVVQLSNGDTVSGTVTGWPADGALRLDAAGREVTVPRERVRTIVFSTELARASKPRSTYRQFVLLNGTRLSVRTAELAGDELKVTTLTGAAVRIPVRVVAAINVYQGRAVYLSDLKPRTYEQSPYLGLPWPVVADHSVAGGDLRLGGGTYDKGIGLHSRSRVTYALPAGARRFEAVVGLDDVTGRSGAVSIDVLADGKSLLDAPPALTGTDSPRTLRLTLPPGAKELTLAVEFGRGGDVQDQVDWADARVITGGAAGE